MSTSFWLYIIAAAAGYCIGSISPAIILSHTLYRTDVRQYGSHNAGFTNFNRTYGAKHSWLVFALDFLKAALVSAFFGWLFARSGGYYQIGTTFAGLFAHIGHAFPIWHHFKGGKCASVIFAVGMITDWRATLIAFAIFIIVILVTRYMSLATIVGVFSETFLLALFGVETPIVLVLMAVMALFVILRHHENIGRLIRREESKFSFRSGRKPPEEKS